MEEKNHNTNTALSYAGLRLLLRFNRKFSDDESFLKDPNAYNDAKNAATLEVIDEPVGVAADKAEDKSRL